MSIEVSNITKIFGEQKALDDLSFSIEPGQIVGFLGPNGAGKSTMMKILTCFIPPTSGQARVNGYDVMENSIDVRRPDVAKEIKGISRFRTIYFGSGCI
jgi:ABC-2 type transport system ATP-binding protein